MNEAVIVLGGSGFVGYHLVDSLMARGQPVIALIRKPEKLPKGVEVHLGTFDTPEHYAALLPCAHTIIHAASCSTPGSTAGKPLEELENNLRPTLALLSALQNQPRCRLVYISSGGTLYGDTSDHLAHEQDKLRPKSYHGAGKAAAEHFIHAAAQQFDLTATVLRPSNLYGPRQKFRHGFGIIPTAFAHAQSGTPLTFWGDGRAVRDYLYIDDFIRLCINIVEQPIPSGFRAFNAANGQGISLMKLIEHIRQITGASLPIRHNLSRSVDIARIELDTRAVIDAYGWKAHVSIEEGLRQTWQWWQAQHP